PGLRRRPGPRVRTQPRARRVPLARRRRHVEQRAVRERQHRRDRPGAGSHESARALRHDLAGDPQAVVARERRPRQRALQARGPRNPEALYVLNVQFMRSKDGGRSFAPVGTPHGDNHDLWIDPDNPLRMIESNDGGVNVTVDGGTTWTKQDNQPTAQFYHVVTDDRFPYRVYGAQQDNSSVSIASRTRAFGIGPTDWYPAGGCESGYIASQPGDPDVDYAGCY